jgi:hypothetical protein
MNLIPISLSGGGSVDLSSDSIYSLESLPLESNVNFPDAVSFIRWRQGDEYGWQLSTQSAQLMASFCPHLSGFTLDGGKDVWLRSSEIFLIQEQGEGSLVKLSLPGNETLSYSIGCTVNQLKEKLNAFKGNPDFLTLPETNVSMPLVSMDSENYPDKVQ